MRKATHWIYESLWVEFMYGEYFNGSANGRLANAFRSTKQRNFSNRGVENWTTIEGLGDEMSSDAVAECVKRLMASAEGDKMRKRATELSKSVVNRGGGGKEMDSFISHITR
uniref:Uncharacterized protein n=1 Tax=Solanum lycopersicum TaxID=4081 RepID=A0A3Q7IKG5_SOLLC